MGADSRRGPVREEYLLTVHMLLEGDRGRDRVQRSHLLTSFQESPHHNLFFQGKKKIFFKILQDDKLYYSRYCQVSYVITGNS